MATGTQTKVLDRFARAKVLQLEHLPDLDLAILLMWIANDDAGVVQTVERSMHCTLGLSGFGPQLSTTELTGPV